jgi:hypothetical protein
MTDRERDIILKAITDNTAMTVNLLVEIRDAIAAQTSRLAQLNTHLQNQQH